MKKFTASAIALALIVSASSASAQTVDIASLLAQIQALQAQIAALTGGSASVGAITKDLAMGARDAEVMTLQKFLNTTGTPVATTGVGSKGYETNYFGAKTKAALMAYQAANGLPVTGMVDSWTRTKIAGKSGSTVVTTGGTTSSGTVVLQGGAGSIDTTDIISRLNNEEVGEDESNVEVAGLEIETDDTSDIALTAVKITFNEGSATSDFEDYADEVSITLDGKEVARLDASEFNDDNDWSKNVSLKSGAVIKSGDTADLVVRVSGISNLDSDDAGDTWTVDFETVRFVDAQGASVTETITESPVTFSFNTFATASDVELKAVLDSASPDAGVVDVDSSDDTDNVELLRFTLEAEGSAIELKDLPITLTVTTATDVDAVANTLYMKIGNEEWSESISTSAAAATVTFEDVDYTIKKDSKVVVIISADINDIDSGFTEGSTLKAEYTASNRNMVDAEDSSGEDLDSADKTGTALGDEMAFYDTGIYVTFVSDSSTVATDDGSDDDTGTFVIKFRVKAFGGDVYVSDTATATTADSITASTIATNGILYLVEDSGVATVDDLADIMTYADVAGDATDSTNGVKLDEGEEAEFTLTVTQTNDSTEDDGIYRTLLKAIGWNTDDSTTFNVYDFDLSDFKTDPISLN